MSRCHKGPGCSLNQAEKGPSIVNVFRGASIISTYRSGGFMKEAGV